jgi:hypothetical protein
MNLLTLGSGFEFDELHSKQKMAVVDRYLFLLDRIRFEYRNHPDYDRFSKVGAFEKEEFIRKLILKALKEIRDKVDSLT